MPMGVRILADCLCVGPGRRSAKSACLQCERNEVGGKTRPKRSKQVWPLVSGSYRAIENEHRGHRGHITVIAQNRPRVRDKITINLQDILSCFQNLAPTGMQEKTSEALKGEIMAM